MEHQNSIIDVEGLLVGQAHDAAVKTDVTVILPTEAATFAVHVRGGGPGTRETDSLSDGGLINKVHSSVLASADGICAWLMGKEIGYSSAAASCISLALMRGIYETIS